MSSQFSLYTRDSISHLIVAAIVFAVMFLLPEGPSKWGLNLKNWRIGLVLGIISGLAFGMLFSFFSSGLNISTWNFGKLITQLKDRGNVIHLLSQLFLIGLSEELFFRGILVTYLMRRYYMKIIGIHLGVIIVSIIGASLQFYKLFFGSTFGAVFPLVIGAFLYFVFLGWMYQRTGSLLGSTVTHNLGNSLMFMISLGI